MVASIARRFEGKGALVTGAAGGIGRAAAVRFASEGARLGLVDVSRDGLRETLAAVEKAGGAGRRLDGLAFHPLPQRGRGQSEGATSATSLGG